MTLIVDLLLTLVVESFIAAFFFKIRQRDELLLIAAMNMITNPMVHIVQYLLRFLTLSYPLIWVFTILAEILVVICEAYFLKKDLDRTEDAEKISICMNAASFLLGLPAMRLLIYLLYI